MSLYNLVSDVFGIPLGVSHNVPAVSDVFLCAIEELRSNSSVQKNVVEQKRAEGEARTRFCGA